MATAHNILHLDRWQVAFESPLNEHEEIKIMNNYFSVGIDAKVALKFHEQRTENPAYFNNQLVNKLWYVKFGTTSITDGCAGISNLINLWIDENKIDLPPELQGIIAVNIPSAYGGANLWNNPHQLNTEKPFRPMRIDDGIIEICGLKGSVHLGQIQSGIAHPLFLGQGKKIVLILDDPLPAQVDGEPWEQTNGKFIISRKNTLPVVSLPKNAHSSLLISSRI